jgi:folate-binding protein YgfZ
LRAKADIVEVEDRAVLWSPDEDLPPRGMPIAVRDERSPALGMRYIVDRADIGEAARGGEEAYATARIGAGIMALGPDFAANEMFPHDLGMDFLSGLDFKKGCYIGQEVVSRMQHRGTARRRPVIVAGLPDGAAPGAPLLVGEREIGTIGAMQSGHAVALVRLDRVSDPHAASFAGLPVDLRLPAWAGYGFGGAGEEE